MPNKVDDSLGKMNLPIDSQSVPVSFIGQFFISSKCGSNSLEGDGRWDIILPVRSPAGHLTREVSSPGAVDARRCRSEGTDYCTSLRTTHQPIWDLSNRSTALYVQQAAIHTAGPDEHGQECHDSRGYNVTEGPGQNQPPISCQSLCNKLLLPHFDSETPKDRKFVLDICFIEGSFGGSFQKSDWRAT